MSTNHLSVFVDVEYFNTLSRVLLVWIRVSFSRYPARPSLQHEHASLSHSTTLTTPNTEWSQYVHAKWKQVSVSITANGRIRAQIRLTANYATGEVHCNTGHSYDECKPTAPHQTSQLGLSLSLSHGCG